MCVNQLLSSAEVSVRLEVSMHDTPTGDPLRTALRAMATGGDASNAADLEALRPRLLAAVDELKAMGWPIERIIVRVKEVIDEAGLPTRSPSDRHGRDLLKSEAVRLCIERYFDR